MAAKVESTRLPEVRQRLKLCLEKNRLDTFTKWVFSDKKACNKKKMAEAGFHFVDNGVDFDCVRCFLCEKTLNCWEPNDDPWLEHQKHSPSCQFATMHKPQSAQTISEFIEIKNIVLAHAIKDLQKKHEAVIQMIYKTAA